MTTSAPDVPPPPAQSAPPAGDNGPHDDSTERYILRLYVAGMTSRSARAVENVRTFCEKHLEGRYDLQVIDVYQQPALAKSEQLIAAPTLIKKLPLPLRRLIGDMSNEDRVLVGLDLVPRT
ncbi:MAG: thiol-disulfide isomerase [Gammaproteobacteria bacterium]|nr:thiol-disulfide isomerase [Gammaproteobacteria bacterium]